MAQIPSLLTSIPDEFKPLASLIFGAIILVCLTLFHGMSLHQILIQYQAGDRRLRLRRPHLIAASLLFGWSVFLMLALHIAEISIWAFALTKSGLVLSAFDALYFCANAYTTLGFGNVDLDKQWRNISPIIGISGLFTFAWTTSALVDVVARYNRLVEQLQLERSVQKRLRSALRKDEWNALMRERDEEKALKQKAHANEAGVSVEERYRIWREEGKQLSQLRRAKAAEIRQLRRHEREQENNLGSPDEAENPVDPK